MTKRKCETEKAADEFEKEGDVGRRRRRREEHKWGAKGEEGQNTVQEKGQRDG